MLRKCLLIVTCLVPLAARVGAEEALLTLEPGDRLRLELGDGAARREGRLLGVDSANRRITVDLGRGPETIETSSVRAAWFGHRRDSAKAGALVGAGLVLIPSLAVTVAAAADDHGRQYEVRNVLYLTASAAALGALVGLAVQHTEWVPIQDRRGPRVSLAAVAPPGGAPGLGAGLRLSW